MSSWYRFIFRRLFLHCIVYAILSELYVDDWSPEPSFSSVTLSILPPTLYHVCNYSFRVSLKSLFFPLIFHIDYELFLFPCRPYIKFTICAKRALIKIVFNIHIKFGVTDTLTVFSVSIHEHVISLHFFLWFQHRFLLGGAFNSV